MSCVVCKRKLPRKGFVHLRTKTLSGKAHTHCSKYYLVRTLMLDAVEPKKSRFSFKSTFIDFANCDGEVQIKFL